MVKPPEPPKPRPMDRKNRVVLPPEVIVALGLKDGDFVAFDVQGREVRLRRVRWSME